MSFPTGEVIAIPSPIDVHVHLREPGTNQSETMTTGTEAALLGGYQAVFDMPNNPGRPTHSIERMTEKIGIALDTSQTNIGFYAGVDLGNPDLDGMRSMAPTAAGLKLYMGHTTGNARPYDLDHARPAIDEWVKENIEIAQAVGRSATPILLHAQEGVADETARYIAQKGNPVHWCHIGTATEVKLAEKLSHDFPDLYTGGVTPHHLTMTDRNARFQQGWNARMMPKLGTEVDQDALLAAYNSGAIQILETDHAPHPIENKLKAESENPQGITDPDCTTCFGVSGIEFVLPVMASLVQRGETTMNRLVDSLYNQPAKMLRLNIGKAALNLTYLRFEPNIIGESDSVGNSINSPYFGWMAGATVVAVNREGLWPYDENSYPDAMPVPKILQADSHI